jgi:hypothetical protein
MGSLLGSILPKRVIADRKGGDRILSHKAKRTKRPDFSGWGTRHEHHATLSANSGGVVEASVPQYFPTLSARPAMIGGQADILPSRGRQASPEVVGSVLSLTQSRASMRITSGRASLRSGTSLRLPGATTNGAITLHRRLQKATTLSPFTPKFLNPCRYQHDSIPLDPSAFNPLFSFGVIPAKSFRYLLIRQIRAFRAFWPGRSNRASLRHARLSAGPFRGPIAPSS